MKKTPILLVMCIVVCIAHAQQLKSPDGNFLMSFSLQPDGAPVYELLYKGKPVVKKSRLGLELLDNSVKQEFNTEIQKSSAAARSGISLYDNFELTDQQTAAFDETWQPVWGETRDIRNYYNELAVT
ncbi:MAG TPA: glycoside hydrolase family 97 N-terminal domain-containing protein, partial [Niabella sp.]|nr:glycoside hydrolase family 97 N-terminal domain-containing protein [Niabella sp.]